MTNAMIKNLTGRKKYHEQRPKVGDRILVKSLDWYNENKCEYGYVEFGINQLTFTDLMKEHCGCYGVIDWVHDYPNEPDGWCCCIEGSQMYFTKKHDRRH